MPPIEHYKGREQTYVKHYFLEHYLERVAYRIGSFRDDFCYVDCFSGPWKAEDPEFGDTSVRIALEKLNSVSRGLSEIERRPRLRALFVEKDPIAYKRLLHLLRDHAGEVDAVSLNGIFEHHLDDISRFVGSRFAFYFIDPTGWDLDMDNLTSLLRAGQCEAMINFMFDFVNRFTGDQRPAIKQSIDRYYGTTEWRAHLDSELRERELVELYVKQIKSLAKFDFASYTRILKPQHERAYFHLAYAARHPTGILKFREVEQKAMPEQDRVREQAQHEHQFQRTGQQSFDLMPISDTISKGLMNERTPRLKQSEELLLQLLARGPRTFAEIQPSLMEIPLVWKSDVDQLVINWNKSGRITLEGMRPRKRKPRGEQIIRLAK
ncbi:MAG: three-Cys-motif partner protein TcmP [Acidobacteria bacterium]|nr:three-Cys-motif partner protein TcmP [Acidobacteriota bacterium]